MLLAELIRDGEHAMTVCNSCRYCEQYCPVFPAMEKRLTFGKADLAYLSNLCHNCGECLYACQYAPPHEFGIDVPRTFAKLRLSSYEEYCWPKLLAGAFRAQGVATGLALSGVLSAIMLVSAWLVNPDSLWRVNPGGDFYAVVPHATMVVLFGGVALFVAAAIVMGVVRFWRDVQGSETTRISAAAFGRAFRDAVTLRHLHSTGVDCTSDQEVRSPWRRRFHHFTFYGFMLCWASTSVAAAYDAFFGWHAPYPIDSVPVLLGMAGGVGLLVGPAGLMFLRRRRDPALTDPQQDGLDSAFLSLLFFTSLTGFLLLLFRDHAVMATLLIVHLAVVLTLFVSLPYGKFVHGFYRLAALIKYRDEVNEPER